MYITLDSSTDESTMTYKAPQCSTEWQSADGLEMPPDQSRQMGAGVLGGVSTESEVIVDLKGI